MAVEPQIAPAPEAPKAPPVADAPEFQDEEIEIPAEEGSPEAPKSEAEAPEPPREKKRRGPKRYAALTHERDEARGYAAQVAAENEELRRRAAEAEERAAKADKVAMQSFAAKAEADLKQARTDHAAALESGDNEKISEATEALAAARQTVEDVKAYQETAAAKPATQAPPAPAPQARPQIQDYPEPVKNWVMQEQNRYWDRNARDDAGNILLDRGGRPVQNPDFDEEMHIEATMIATKLERQIAAKKLPYKVASPEYFKAIEDHMAKEFPEHFDGEEEEESPAPAPRRPSPVAAPSRSAPAQAGQSSTQKVKLTADQIRFVQKQVDNGGGPKYPKGHPKQFQPMTFDDAKVSFARRLQTQAKEQQG